MRRKRCTEDSSKPERKATRFSALCPSICSSHNERSVQNGILLRLGDEKKLKLSSFLRRNLVDPSTLYYPCSRSRSCCGPTTLPGVGPLNLHGGTCACDGYSWGLYNFHFLSTTYNLRISRTTVNHSKSRITGTRELRSAIGCVRRDKCSLIKGSITAVYCARTFDGSDRGLIILYQSKILDSNLALPTY